MSKYININFPFKDSPKGFFLDLTEVDAQAIKADLLHLILTRKGQRLYNPDFGTNLMRYIFEPNDGFTLNQIKEELILQISKYLPMLKLNNLSVTESEENEYVAIVRLDYSVTDLVFTTNDFVIIKI